MVKKILIFLLMVSLLVSISFAAIASTPTGVRLTWSASPVSTQTINWTTDTATAQCFIQYKSNGSYVTVTAPAPSAYQDVKLWSMTLYNLSANTTYSYRVGDGANWSPYYTFKTAPNTASKFKFLVFGDTSNEDLEYSGESKRWGENVNGALLRNPDAKFVMNVGDTVDKGQFYTDWAAWLAAANTVPAKIPFMLTVAKDECNWGGDYPPVPDETSPPVLFQKMWTYPQNGPVNYKGQAYSYDYGNVHFVSIPNQLSGYYPSDEAAQDAMLAEVAAWLKADLAATTKKWKVVQMHLNFYTTMTDRSAVKYRNVLQPILDQYHVDVVFDGHVHTIARTYPIKNRVMYAKPAEGTVYYTVGMGQSEPKEDVSKKLWHHFTYDGQTKANYLAVEVDGDELEIECYLDDGTKIDEYKIDKADPSECTITIPPPPYDATHMVIYGQIVFCWNSILAEEGYGALPFKDNDPEEEIPDLIPNGEWCFDVKTFSTLMNGVWYPNERKLVYDDLELELYFPADTVSLDGNYVSEVGLAAVGFDIYYDENLNLWFVERYRP